MRKITSLFLILILGLSCQLSGQSNYQLSPQEFEKKTREPQVQVLDVRTATEYKSGYLAGALQANWQDSKEFAERTQYLDPKKPILIYCAGGVRSADAAVQLRSKGYTVYELSGGINKYKKEGLPIVADEPIQQLSTSDYNKLILSAETVLVDFGAPWCPPCRKMEPVLTELQKSQQGNFKLQKIDGGIHIELMKALQVDALPHFIVYKKGIKTWEKQGIVSLEELKKAIL